MTRAAEWTGPGPMALVAIEQPIAPERCILVDELAGRMLPFGGRVFLAATDLPAARDRLVRLVDNAFPGLWAGGMVAQNTVEELGVEIK